MKRSKETETLNSLENIQEHIFSKIDKPRQPIYQKEIVQTVRNSLGSAFKFGLSTSFVMVGDESRSIMTLLNESISSFEQPHSMARLSATLFPNDFEGMLEIYNQLVPAGPIRDSVRIMEDLEEHFKQCKIIGKPALIILEDFHLFLQKNRQMLIYFFLDLVQKKDQLFVLVGMTGVCTYTLRMEKRTASRYNKEFLIMPNPSAADICLELSRLLTLENQGEDGSFEEKFNQAVHDLFGAPDDFIPLNNSRVHDELENEEIVVPIQKKKCKLFELIQLQREMGFDHEFFEHVALTTVSRLRPNNPFLSFDLFVQTMASMEPLSLSEKLIGLTELELNLFACITRAHALRLMARDQGKPQETQAQKPGFNRKRVSVSSLMSDLDMTTQVISNKLVSPAHVLKAFISLAETGLVHLSDHPRCRGDSYWGVDPRDRCSHGHVTGATLVYNLFNVEEAKDAFVVRSQERVTAVYRGRERPTLKVSEKVRRAVLEPLQPLHYSMLNNQTSTKTLDTSVISHNIGLRLDQFG